MKITSIALVTLFSISVQAFAPQTTSYTTPRGSVLYADTQEAPTEAKVSRPKVQQLGLLTFDLDDTLYPIGPCVEAANNAFVTAMEKYGFPGLSAFDIVETGKIVREEIANEDPEKAAALTHTEIRELAIRREMEKVILERKLQSTAEDWATQVSSLSPIVRKHAQDWAKTAVSESVVQSVLTQWEMERHHAAERYIFPHVIESLKKIKEEHPNVVIGAVTDGRANPLLMTFTLAPYFDFCMSWEDDQGGRQQFFKELDTVDAKAELRWIYDAARHKYAILKEAQDAIDSAQSDEAEIQPLVWPATYDDLAWIHVGDDLAFDVGGSAACGAKTVLVELPRSVGQTAPFRFDLSVQQPAWSTTSRKELEARIAMNEKARPKVNAEINTMERLPIAINEILRGDA
eukprot:CAMPEP_0113621902 /NCGR_PEP_ID=MMETSP0017_2-20120614/11208_1 /TAXON_ID=2856 /ORGANISM="Cylindrotheca closterium" /LENGTH=402 /DNA_ID=CAMNT_0000531689 /DNA_START=207 /DNA_END=1415 /DNA_ORIENTATION=- /assembly_acc=CAM_ASM_000147